MKKFFKALLKWETIGVIFILGSIVGIVLGAFPSEIAWICAGISIIMVAIADTVNNLTKSDSQYDGMMNREQIESLIEFTKGYSDFVKHDLTDDDGEASTEIKNEILKDNVLIIATLETVLEGAK